jgi:phosphatidylinositol-3-phosphatase
MGSQTLSGIRTSNYCVEKIAKHQGRTPAVVAVAIALAALLGSLEVGCGGRSNSPLSTIPTPTPTPSPTSPATGFPTFNHVFLVVEENHSFSEVIGNSSMPYFNSLAAQYGLAKQYFANAHPSLPDYLMLTTGQAETFDDNFSGPINDDNIARELVNAGKSWRAYQESIPSAGYLGADVPPYVHRHNPFSYLSDVQNSPSQAANIVPFSQFATDLANNALPQFSFITPNLDNDAHDGTLAAADSWLQSNIAPLIASTAFKSGGLLVITFDEGKEADLDHGGGQVATLIISSNAKPNYQSQTLYQHQSVLRLMLAASGVNKFPGQAASAPDMAEFFNRH